MKKSMKRVSSMFIVLCMLVASIPQAIFASDYENHWAKEAIAKWSKKGIVVGYEDGTFRPANQITRGELATILVRVFNLSDTANATEYVDVVGDKWYADSIAIASSAKLIHEEGDKFRPEEPATREEAAYAIAKAYKISGTTYNDFSDQASISDWANGSISALTEKGFLNGYPDGTFGPKRTLSRAEVVTMIDNITDGLINVAGTYTDDVNGNLVVNTRDVILKDMTISGNLYLTEGIGDGDVTLENITVEGETFVNGGGLNSIKSKDSKFLKSMKVSAKNPVRLVIIGDAVKVEAFPGTTVTLTGNFSDVILPPGVNVVIKDATVGKIFIEPGFAEDKDVPKAVITIVEGSTVKDIQADAPVETKGKGTIENLVVNSDGVKTEQKPTKTEIKDKDIKADIAGKEETKETTETAKPKTPSTPSTGGGGSSSSSGSSSGSESIPAKYRISGKVTCEGDVEGVGGVYVNIWGSGTEQFHTSARTDENGNYSFYVPSGHTYQIGAPFVDENRFGYEKLVYDVVANSNKTVNIALDMVNVANILVTDKNNTPIPHVILREVVDGNHYGSSYQTDYDGWATIFIHDKNDFNREWDIFLNDVKIGTTEKIKYIKEYKSEYAVSLANYGITEKLVGTVVGVNGEPVKGAEVILYRIEDRKWNPVGTATTDKDGHYAFSELGTDASYIVEARYLEGDNAYISDDLNALLVGKNDLVIKQLYTIKIKVTDQADVGIGNAQIKVIHDDGGYHTTGTFSDGTQLVYYTHLVPGDYKVQVTVGDQVIIKPLTITDGKYNYSLDFEFGNVVQRVLTVELENRLSIDVGDATLTAHNITFADKDGGVGRAWADFDEKGKAILIIPEDFNSDEAVLFIRTKGGFLICRKDVSLTDVDMPAINLEDEVQRLSLLGDLEIAPITTGSIIELSTTSSITLRLGDKNCNTEVAKIDFENDDMSFEIVNLISGTYTLVIKYKIDNVEYTFEKEISVELNDIWGLEDGEWGSIPQPIVITKQDHILTITLFAGGPGGLD